MFVRLRVVQCRSLVDRFLSFLKEVPSAITPTFKGSLNMPANLGDHTLVSDWSMGMEVVGYSDMKRKWRFNCLSMLFWTCIVPTVGRKCRV